MHVIVDDKSINYNDNGDGEIVVLLHGWGDSLSTFKILENYLSKNYRTISLDLPGFGKSELDHDNYSLEKYADFLSNFLDKLNIKEVYSFIGHSNGGAILIKGISENILESKKLILISSSGVRSIYKDRIKLLRITAKTLKYPTKLIPGKFANKLKKTAYKKIGSDIFVAENLMNTFKNIVGDDITENAKKIKNPTLLIYGSDDEATPLEIAKLLNSSIQSSRLEVIVGGDHFIHQNKSKLVEKFCSEFLNV